MQHESGERLFSNNGTRKESGRWAQDKSEQTKGTREWRLPDFKGFLDLRVTGKANKPSERMCMRR